MLLDETICGCGCGTETCSVVPEAMAVYLSWNGRQQRTGLTQLAGVRTLLDDVAGPLDGPGRVLSRVEVNAHLHAVTLSNLDRVTERTVLSPYHFDASVPANAARLRLHEVERGSPRVERTTDGALAATPRVGDTVKLALNLAAVYELVAGEGAISPQQLADIRRKHADERYWAHVLAVELDEDRGELMLTVLSSANMRNMPAAIVSEPYEVALRNVMAVHPHA